MKKLFLLLFLIPIVSFVQTYENPNPPQPIKIEVENKSNPYATPANNARQSSGVNLKGITGESWFITDDEKDTTKPIKEPILSKIALDMTNV